MMLHLLLSVVVTNVNNVYNFDSLQTSSAKFAHLNSVAIVFEFEVDENGNTHAKFWEWK